MNSELSGDRLKRYEAIRFQNLLKEYGALLQDVIKDTIEEYSQEIMEDTVDKIAITYSKSQGARQALQLFIKKLNSKANG